MVLVDGDGGASVLGSMVVGGEDGWVEGAVAASAISTSCESKCCIGSEGGGLDGDRIKGEEECMSSNSIAGMTESVIDENRSDDMVVIRSSSARSAGGEERTCSAENDGSGWWLGVDEAEDKDRVMLESASVGSVEERAVGERMNSKGFEGGCWACGSP